MGWGSHGGLAECWSGERPLSERRRGFGGKNSVRPAHPGAYGGVGSSPVFLPCGVVLNPSGNPPPDPRAFFHPQQLAWVIFLLIILVSSSYSDPAPASRPSLLHWIYGVALKRKQVWGGGQLPTKSLQSKFKPKTAFLYCCPPGLGRGEALPCPSTNPKSSSTTSSPPGVLWSSVGMGDELPVGFPSLSKDKSQC